MVTARLLQSHSKNWRRYPRGASYHSLSGGTVIRRDEDKENKSHSQTYHTTTVDSRAAAIILGLGTVSAVAYAGSSAVRAYKEYQEDAAKYATEQAKRAKEEPSSPPPKDEPKAEQQKEGERENIFASWFGANVGAKYYEGGFEETMTKREAALILGVRESSSVQRVKEAHRKLLILNHPDTGGSTYLAGKLNEAKELLLKGRRA